MTSDPAASPPAAGPGDVPAQLLAAVEASPETFVALDREWRVVAVNAATERAAGKPRAELLGKTHWEAWPESAGGELEHRFRRAIAEGEPARFEYRPPGAVPECCLEVCAYPSTAGLAIFARDVTAEKQAEAALAAANDRFALAARAINAIIYDWDVPSGRVTRSGRLPEVLGYEVGEDEPTRDWWSALIHPDDRPSPESGSQRLAGTEDGFSAQYRVRHRDGRWVTLWDNALVVRDAAGQPTRIVGTSIDVSGRVAMEEELREQERFITAVAATTPTLIYVYDLATETNRYANRRLETMLGYTTADLAALGPNFLARLVHPDDLATVRDRAARVRDAPDGEMVEVEYRLRHRDGSWRWLRGCDTVFRRDAAGRPSQILGTAEDVTERKQHEAALRAGEERFRTLAETVPGLVWVDDVAGANEYMNARWQELTGQATTEATGDGWTAVTHPDDVPRVRQRWARSRATGEPYEAELRHRRPDGTYRWFLARAHPLRDATGEVVRWVGASIDIEDRKRAEFDLRDSEARFRGLFEGIADGVVVTGADGRYVEVNAAFVELTGYAREELIGRRVPILGADPDLSGRAYDRLRRDGTWQGEAEVEHKAGYRFPVESRARRVDLPSGPVFIGTMRDISERRELERLREEGLGALAHDLRNPLAAAKGQSQLLRRRLRQADGAAPAKVGEGLAAVEASLDRAVAMIDEMLDVARLRAGRPLGLNPTATDLTKLLATVVDEYARTTDRHRLVVAAPPEPLVLTVDRPRLERVIGNLLANAIKYSPDGGEITATLSRRQDAAGAWTELAITDRGIGIPAADLPHVFERYRRGANVSAAMAGTGIGLAGARRIVEQHGGTITVASREGAGSTFTLRLPEEGRTEG